ncbi:MAG: hypothetical protein ACRCXB_33360 [Aeromonadaceae bacterium]
MRLVIIESPYAGGEQLDLTSLTCYQQHSGMWVACDISGIYGKGCSRSDALRAAIIDRNTKYARRALLDSLERGEAPYASHLLYTQVLDDSTPEQRWHGLEAGWAWQSVVDAVVVYTDWGISVGMQAAIDSAKCPVEYRSIGR